jgi:citrate synthase
MSTERSFARARALVAEALGLALDNVSIEDRLHRLRNWDSLGQVSIALAIEEMLGIEIVDESTFISLTSVRGIANYLSLVRGLDEGRD